MLEHQKRDHGGGLDAALAKFGGARADWLDLSTGINPTPYPVPDVPASVWAELPDDAAMLSLQQAARTFWALPDEIEIVPATGASALISLVPHLRKASRVAIAKPTYNEHEAAFVQAGWSVDDAAQTRVFVHPNNPDGRLTSAAQISKTNGFVVIDESFCDVCPANSLAPLAARKNVVVLKSFGKFWGLAGLRLGFALCRSDLAEEIRARLGPWAVSGPALHIGAMALRDPEWARNTRTRLSQEALRLDHLVTSSAGRLIGGTDLFRLYEFPSASQIQTHLADHKIWSRVFPYSQTWLRLGLPGTPEGWNRLDAAFKGLK